MVEDRSVAKQTHEIINIEHALADAEMKLPEKFLGITEKTVSVGNSSTAKVLGGSVDLKFPSEVPLKHDTNTPFELCGIQKKRKKLGHKTVDSVFLGYVETSYALRFLVIKLEISGIEVNTIVEFRDSVFLEVDEPRRSKRARVVKDFGSDFVTYNVEDDPVTFKDAMASLEARQFKEAVKSEMDSIVSNGTWVLVDLPLGCTTIGCKWIFKKKLKPDGTVDKFKARLVAKDFKQKDVIDYFDTYSPVARLTIIWVLIALVLVYNIPIHQMDVKTAFLYGELEEEIYMVQPEGYVAHGHPLPPIVVYCDSQTTIAKVMSRKYNQKTKRHIQGKLESIRALVSDRVIGIDFVGTKNNVADPLTKGLDLSSIQIQIGDGTENPSVI
ncbi:UNVERIFIED_CONTAM: Retrovirus-related Pol polyprotein from transposon TNT 1-94 [Sesamum calycinum]|uniref:Retrovirus-related Pol polyprotein from transposon TNT 1-94 n=1 Tax=Sesamum calycinum TaxID=2727403 RepID=A0AAW2IW64_9LAMI